MRCSPGSGSRSRRGAFDLPPLPLPRAILHVSAVRTKLHTTSRILSPLPGNGRPHFYETRDMRRRP